MPSDFKFTPIAQRKFNARMRQACQPIVIACKQRMKRASVITRCFLRRFCMRFDQVNPPAAGAETFTHRRASEPRADDDGAGAAVARTGMRVQLLTTFNRKLLSSGSVFTFALQHSLNIQVFRVPPASG